MDILGALDSEISRLTQARNLLAGQQQTKRRGRPPGSKNGNTALAKPGGMTPEGRARLAKAMRERWAKRRAAMGKKAA